LSAPSSAQINALCCELQRMQQKLGAFATYIQQLMLTRPPSGGGPALQQLQQQVQQPQAEARQDISKLVHKEDLDELPGVLKHDAYMYNDTGISAAVPQLYIDVVKQLDHPATSGFILSDTQTIKVDLNNKGSPITLNAGERFTLSPLDPFEIQKIRITSASVTAGVRIFMT